jgi:tetratricopeptide (TPR) repeat protein
VGGDYHQRAWFNRENVLDSLGKPEEALDALNKATEFNPNDYESWCRKAMVLSALGEHEEARKAYDKALIHPS